MSREKEPQSESQTPTDEPAAAAPAPGRAPRAVQRKGGDASPEDVQAAADVGVSGPSQSLPHLDSIQSSFGSHDVRNVEAHLGLNASEVNQMLGSEAYATGNDVAFADSSPTLHTAAHEAAHVVQQRGGVQLKGGVGEAGDRYEQHADQVADAVVAGESAEALLDQMAPAGSASSSGAGVQRKVVQMRGPEGGGGSGGSGGAGGTSGSGGSEGAGGTGGTGGTAASGGEAAGGGAEGGAEDNWETFKQAIAAYNAGDAETAWGKLKKDEKAKLKSDGDAQVKLMHTLHKGSIKMFKEGGVNWSNHVTNLSVFLMPDFDDWYDELWNHGLYQSFREAYPVKGQVPDSAAKKIQGWMNVVAGDIGAELLFEKVYPKLNASAANNREKVAAWSKDKIVRLYNILSGSAPVGHIQTISGGFTLVDKTKEWDKKAKKWTWPTLGFAWWEPWSFRCVLNNSSSGANEGGTGHGMTGGDYSGANNNYTMPDGTAGTNTSQSHLHTSALHEVGHGVGQRMGGDAYALNPGSWPGWQAVDPDDWAAAQWDAGATAGSPPGGLDEDAGLDEDDARDFMITEITDGKGSWSSWGNGASRSDIAKYIDAVYSNQPLYTQWDKIVKRGGGDGAYHQAQKRSGWAYTYVTRWTAPHTAKYKAAAYDQKVSWYGLSSPKEWFAEQYAHYYRTEKTGGGLIDAATKALLDRLDSQEFVPTNADGSEGVVVGGGQGAGGQAAGGAAGTPSGARASGGSGNAADAGSDLAESGGPGGDQTAEDPSQYRTPPEGSRPIFFPW